MAKYHVMLLRHGIQLIKQIEPRYWLIENPMGMMRRVLGAPTVHTAWCAFGTSHKKPTDLWGRLPAMEWPIPVKWEKAARGTKSGTQGITRESWMPKGLTSGMLRSLIPTLFSLSLREAIEREVSIESRLLDSCDAVLRAGLPLKKKKLKPVITYVGKKYK
jgi:hypothetical protein